MSPLSYNSLHSEPDSSPTFRYPQYNPNRCLYFGTFTRATITLRFPSHNSPKPPPSKTHHSFRIRLSPPGILSAIQPVMTAFARYSSTTGIATAIYAWPTKSPSISKLSSRTSSNAYCSAVTLMAAMPVTCPRFLYQEL